MYQTLSYIALLSGFVPFVLLVFKAKGTKGCLKAPIVPFVFLTAISSMYELIATTMLKINTSYWFQLYSLLEFSTILYFFNNINKNKLFNAGSFVILTIIYIISFFYWNSSNALNALTINNSSLTFYVMISLILWIKALFKENDVDNLWKHPDYYFVSAFALYYFSTAFLFLMSNNLFKSEDYFLDFWILNIIATIIFRVLLSVGVWKMK
ncbi:MAG TPA: hypothetical protein VLZ83_10610 [Edaphocola sp.]|nr:hypothetical protein [Edaphocola sp.]